MTLEQILDELMEEFDKTKFATGGGSSFECSDYEGKYIELKDFIKSQIAKACNKALLAVNVRDDELYDFSDDGLFDFSETSGARKMFNYTRDLQEQKRKEFLNLK
jgi:hypothetical protein